MKMYKSKLNEDKGIFYSSRVRIGNWYEDSKLEEAKLNMFVDPMIRGEILLAKYRKMCKNLNAPTTLSPSTGTIAFGEKICLFAPHVPATFPSSEDAKGLFLGGQLRSDDLLVTQDLCNGCSMAGLPDLLPQEKNTFVITSNDNCNRDGETLKYDQEFRLTLSKSVNEKMIVNNIPISNAKLTLIKKETQRGPEFLKLIEYINMGWPDHKSQPLYVRFDPNPIPGLCGKFPLSLSEHAVSNTRWRVLPVQVPHITRFEQEGKPVPVNTDIIINHCSTNINLGIDTGKWMTGFFGKSCASLMKTCLDGHGRELPHNVWHIFSPE